MTTTQDPNMLKVARSYAANSYRASVVHDHDGCPSAHTEAPQERPGA
jgi:hypothetical protein